MQAIIEKCIRFPISNIIYRGQTDSVVVTLSKFNHGSRVDCGMLHNVELNDIS